MTKQFMEWTRENDTTDRLHEIISMAKQDDPCTVIFKYDDSTVRVSGKVSIPGPGTDPFVASFAIRDADYVSITTEVESREERLAAEIIKALWGKDGTPSRYPSCRAAIIKAIRDFEQAEKKKTQEAYR